MTRNERIADHMLYDGYLARGDNRPTLVPASYDALEAEVYNLLEDITERDTIAPPPSSQITLELACAGLEVEW